MRKKLNVFLACCCLLLGNTAYADNLSMGTISQTSNANSLNVRVVEYVDGEEVVVYTGPVSQYNNGLCASIDFQINNFAVVLEWDDPDAVYYVFPTATNTENTQMSSTSQTLTAGTQSTQSNVLSEGIISNEEGLSFTSQIKINGVNTGEDGLRIMDDAYLECTFNVTNSTNLGKDITLLLATYDDDNRMVNVKKSDITVPSNLSGNVNVVYQFNAETEKNAKLMLWHSGMMPVKASVDFDGESGANAYYYDANNRLIQVDKINGVSLLYSYDNMGNLLAKAVRE